MTTYRSIHADCMYYMYEYFTIDDVDYIPVYIIGSEMYRAHDIINHER